MVHKRLGQTRPVTQSDEPRRFRVDIRLNETGQYAEYTSRKQLVTEGMARSLAEGLKRGNERGSTGGRIVEICEPNELRVAERVIDQWEAR
jgi:hypothetical protein